MNLSREILHGMLRHHCFFIKDSTREKSLSCLVFLLPMTLFAKTILEEQKTQQPVKSIIFTRL